MPNYIDPLEIAIKIIADSSNVGEVIKEMQKQGIKLPATIDEKDVEKSVKQVNEGLKKSPQKLYIENKDAQIQIAQFAAQAQKTFNTLKKQLGAVFEQKDANGLEKQISLLQKMEAITQAIPKGFKLDTTFAVNDKSKISTTQEYNDLLYKRIQLQRELQAAEVGSALSGQQSDVVAGLKTSYISTQKILPILVQELKNLADSGTASADQLKAKFTEVYSVFQVFKSSAKQLNELGERNDAGKVFPTELSTAKYKDLISLSDQSFQKNGKITNQILEQVGGLEKYKQLTKEILGDQKLISETTVKAIGSTVAAPGASIGGISADAAQKYATSVGQASAAQNELSQAITKTPLQQAAEDFKRIAGYMKGNTEVAGELKTKINEVFTTDTGRVATLEELRELIDLTQKYQDAIEILRKSGSKTLSIAHLTEGGVKGTSQINSIVTQAENIKKIVSVLYEYEQKQMKINELLREQASITPSKSGNLTKDQVTELTNISKELNILKQDFKDVSKEYDAVQRKLTSNLSSGLGSYFGQFKFGQELDGSTVDKPYKIEKNLEALRGTFTQTKQALLADAAGMGKTISSALNNATKEIDSKIDTNKQAEANAQAQANGVLVSKAQAEAQQKVLELEKQLSNALEANKEAEYNLLNAEKQRVDLQKEMADAAKRMVDLENSIADLQKENSGLKNEKSNLDFMSAEWAKEVLSLEREKLELTEVIAKLKEEAAAKNENYVESQKYIEAQNTIARNERKIARLRGQLEQYDIDITLKNAEINSLLQERVSLQQKLTELSKAQKSNEDKIETLKSQVGIAKDIEKALRSQVKETSKNSEKAEEYRQKLSAIQADIKTKQSEINKLKKEENKISKEATTLQEKLAQSQEKAAAAQKQLAASKKQLEATAKTSDRRGTQLDSVKEELKEQKALLATLQKQFNTQEKTVQKLQEKNGLLRSQVKESQSTYISKDQFKSVIDSIQELNKAIADKSTILKESTQSDLEFLQKINSRIIEITDNVLKMYKGFSESKGAAEAINTAFANIKPKIISFDSEIALKNLRTQAESALANLKLSFKLPDSVNATLAVNGGGLNKTENGSNVLPAAAGTTDSTKGSVDSTMQYLKREIKTTQNEIIKLNQDLSLTPQQIQKAGEEYENLLKKMQGMEKQKSLSKDNIIEIGKLKAGVKGLISEYNNFNKSLEKYNQLLSQGPDLSTKATAVQGVKLNEAFDGINKLGTLSSNMPVDKLQDFVAQVQSLDTIAKDIQQTFARIKLPDNLNSQIDQLNKPSAQGTGTKYLLSQYEDIANKIRQIGLGTAEVSIEEKKGILENIKALDQKKNKVIEINQAYSSIVQNRDVINAKATPEQNTLLNNALSQTTFAVAGKTGDFETQAKELNNIQGIIRDIAKNYNSISLPKDLSKQLQELSSLGTKTLNSKFSKELISGYTTLDQKLKEITSSGQALTLSEKQQLADSIKTLDARKQKYLEISGVIEKSKNATITSNKDLQPDQVKNLESEYRKLYTSIQRAGKTRAITNEDITLIKSKAAELNKLSQSYLMYNAAVQNNLTLFSQRDSSLLKASPEDQAKYVNQESTLLSKRPTNFSDIDSVKEYVVEVNKLGKLAADIETKYAKLKLPPDLTDSLKQVTDINMENLLNQFKQMDTLLKGIASGSQKVSYTEKEHILSTIQSLEAEKTEALKLYSVFDQIRQNQNAINQKATPEQQAYLSTLLGKAESTLANNKNLEAQNKIIERLKMSVKDINQEYNKLKLPQNLSVQLQQLKDSTLAVNAPEAVKGIIQEYASIDAKLKQITVSGQELSLSEKQQIKDSISALDIRKQKLIEIDTIISRSKESSITYGADLTQEQIQLLQAQYQKLYDSAQKLSNVTSINDQETAKIKNRIADIESLTTRYEKYNSTLRYLQDVDQKKSSYMSMASSENQAALTQQRNVVASNMPVNFDADSVRAYLTEVGKLDQIISNIQTEYNNLKLPVDITTTMEALRDTTKTGLDATGTKRLLEEYTALDNKVKQLTADQHDLTYAEAQEVRESYNTLEERRKKYIEVNALIKEMNDLYQQAQRRNNVAPAQMQDLDKLRQSLGIDYNAALNAQGSQAQVATFNTLATSLSNCTKQFNVLRENIQKGIGADKAAVSSAKLSYQLNKLITDMVTYRTENSRLASDASLLNKFNTLLSSMKNIQAQGNVTAEVLMKLKAEATNFKTAVQMAGKMGRSFGDELSYIASKIGVKALLGGFTYRIISYFRKMVDNTKELDTAMTNLKRVTNETDDAYAQFSEDMAKASRELGVGYAELTAAAAEWAKLGYSMKQAGELGKAASMYAKVSWQDVSNATTSMVSMVKAFDIPASKAISLVEKLNIVGNSFAVSAADIGDGLQRSASALRVANNSFEESVALFTSGQEISQNAEKVGTALTATSMRLRGATAELKEAGEETDEFCDSTAKMRKAVEQLSGVDIMLDENTFKSTTQILRELAEVYGRLTDKNQANKLPVCIVICNIITYLKPVKPKSLITTMRLKQVA